MRPPVRANPVGVLRVGEENEDDLPRPSGVDEGGPELPSPICRLSLGPDRPGPMLAGMILGVHDQTPRFRVVVDELPEDRAVRVEDPGAGHPEPYHGRAEHVP